MTATAIAGETESAHAAAAHAAMGSVDWAAKVQRTWAELAVAERLKVLRRWRHAMAGQADVLCEAVGATARTAADVRVSEILPLLAACEFLEKNAAEILAPRRLGGRGLPMWLPGVRAEVQRVALGRVLVIGPSNYPLFLPGVQVLQALAAGNAVTWKPGRGGGEVARVFAAGMADAGLPEELLRVTDDSVAAGEAAVDAGADKVFFTGCAGAGRAVLRRLAETATPSVMELSDSSAVIVLPEAELGRVATAVAFGMRLNGGETCMGPRRLLVMGATTARREALVGRLEREIAEMAPAMLDGAVLRRMFEMVEEARQAGATVLGEVGRVSGAGRQGEQRPVLVVGVRPEMRIAQTDLFAPLLCVMDVRDISELAAAQRACPFGLAVSIFGPEPDARRLAIRLTVGTVVINDVIVPTADPRVPFGGRRGSGFGVTRGAEGLLEMTAAKTVLARRGRSVRQYEVTGAEHAGLFDGLMQAGHAGSWRERWHGLKQTVSAGRVLAKTQKDAGKRGEMHGR